MLMSAEPFWEIVFDPDGKEPESRWFPVCGKEIECVRTPEAPEGWTVRRLISTALSDYLDPAFQPGTAYCPESGNAKD